MADDGMRDVVLTDDDARPSPRVGHRWGRGRTRGWLVVAALLAVLLTAVVVQAARDGDRATRLAGTPGLLAPSSPVPRPSWRIAAGGGDLVVADDDVLVTGTLDDGEQRLVASDAATGVRRWQTALAQVPIGQSLGCELLRRDGAAVSTHLVCRLAAPRPAGVAFPGYGPGSEQRLVLLDARTGRILDDRSLGLGFVAMAAHDGDVLLADVGQDGRVRLLRQDPVARAVRWTFTGDEPLPGVGDGVGPQAPDVRVERGVVVLEGLVSWALSPDDGAVLGQWRSAGPGGPASAGPAWGGPGPGGPASGGPLEVTVLPDGRFAVGDPRSVGTAGARYGAVVTGDGRELFAIDGPVLALVVDDRSAADVLLTVPPGTGRVVAVRSSTGQRLWAAEGLGGGGEAMVLDGRLVTRSGDALTALDARTGRTLWTALRGRLTSDPQPVTDGHVVAVATRDGGTGSLTAVDLADGRTRWSVPGPAGVRGYLAAEGRLFARGDDHLIRMW